MLSKKYWALLLCLFVSCGHMHSFIIDYVHYKIDGKQLYLLGDCHKPCLQDRLDLYTLLGHVSTLDRIEDNVGLVLEAFEEKIDWSSAYDGLSKGLGGNTLFCCMLASLSFLYDSLKQHVTCYAADPRQKAVQELYYLVKEIIDQDKGDLVLVISHCSYLTKNSCFEALFQQVPCYNYSDEQVFKLGQNFPGFAQRFLQFKLRVSAYGKNLVLNPFVGVSDIVSDLVDYNFCFNICAALQQHDKVICLTGAYHTYNIQRLLLLDPAITENITEDDLLKKFEQKKFKHKDMLQDIFGKSLSFEQVASNISPFLTTYQPLDQRKFLLSDAHAVLHKKYYDVVMDEQRQKFDILSSEFADQIDINIDFFS